MSMRPPTERARHEGFSDGVILALQVMTAAGGMGGPDYEALLEAAGATDVYERARSEGVLRLSGLQEYVMQEFHEPSIRLRKELGLDA